MATAMFIGVYNLAMLIGIDFDNTIAAYDVAVAAAGFAIPDEDVPYPAFSPWREIEEAVFGPGG